MPSPTARRDPVSCTRRCCFRDTAGIAATGQGSYTRRLRSVRVLSSPKSRCKWWNMQPTSRPPQCQPGRSGGRSYPLRPRGQSPLSVKPGPSFLCGRHKGQPSVQSRSSRIGFYRRPRPSRNAPRRKEACMKGCLWNWNRLATKHRLARTPAPHNLELVARWAWSAALAVGTAFMPRWGVETCTSLANQGPVASANPPLLLSLRGTKQ